MKTTSTLPSWSSIDILSLKIKDVTGRIIYKTSVDINNFEKVASALLILEKYGVDIDKVYAYMKDKQDELKHYPMKKIWDLSFDPKDTPFAK